MAPPPTSLEGALAAGRALLHNPLGPDASPEAAEQWRDDVDHLIIAAINTPPHRSWWDHHSSGSPELSPTLSCTLKAACTPSATHTLTATRTPTVAILTTTDLRFELEHHCSGEDDHTIIECQCEMRHNHNDHYDTMNAATAEHAVHTPTSPGSGGRCTELAPHVRVMVWPCKFWPHLPKKYDGTINPIEFLQIYTTSILVAGGNEAIMANYFSVALTSSAQLWLMNLTGSAQL
jgi:hypothetical protein